MAGAQLRVILVDDAPLGREGIARLVTDQGVDVVARGGTAIDPEVVPDVREAPRWADPVARLTPKEREVLALVAEGHSNERIAERLGVTTRTVESHTGRIFTKLGLEADPTTHRRVLAVLAHLRASASA